MAKLTAITVLQEAAKLKEQKSKITKDLNGMRKTTSPSGVYPTSI